MDKIAPYKSIKNVIEAGLLECPCTGTRCSMCIYHDFCGAVIKAVEEARKLSETDAKIKGIIGEVYEKRHTLQA
jgi:hypothetical protein